MSDGWIKLHRQLVHWEWYTDVKTCHLFLHLLMKANHADGNHQGIAIKRGQLKTGTLKLSSQTGLSRQSIRTSLEKLKSTNEISIVATNKFSIITIENYGE